MPYPVLSFANVTYAVMPQGIRRASLRIQAPYPVIANAGVGAFRQVPGANNWMKLPTGLIDNSSDTVTPDVFDLSVEPGFEYAFTFKGSAVAVAPGVNAVEVSFGLFADDVVLLSDLGGSKRAAARAAGIVGAAYFRT